MSFSCYSPHVSLHYRKERVRVELMNDPSGLSKDMSASGLRWLPILHSKYHLPIYLFITKRKQKREREKKANGLLVSSREIWRIL